MAPFYYCLANALSTYVECNVDEMNNLKPLELPDDDEEEESLAQENITVNIQEYEKGSNDPEIISDK